VTMWARTTVQQKQQMARAKINLTLHVGRAIADSSDAFYRYHPLDSLIVFADVGDELSCTLAKTEGLSCEGPFGGNLHADPSNLILRAYHAVARRADIPKLHFTLIKNLPVASGIGGGSADAAATLRLLRSYAELPDDIWTDIALSLGADVPVCFLSQTARMTGIGETVEPLPNCGHLQAVLVNPGVAVSTRDIFKSFDNGVPAEMPRPQNLKGDLLAIALAGDNDLLEAASAQQPVIKDILRSLASQPGCQLARMSGSGATCFGIFESQKAAQIAYKTISQSMPQWWCAATVLGDII